MKVPAHFTFTNAVSEQTSKKMTTLPLPSFVILGRLHSFLIYKRRVIVYRKHDNFTIIITINLCQSNG